MNYDFRRTEEYKKNLAQFTLGTVVYVKNRDLYGHVTGFCENSSRETLINIRMEKANSDIINQDTYSVAFHPSNLEILS